MSSTESPTTVSPKKSVWRLLWVTIESWQTDNVPRLGAALAYYTVFSLAPLLVIALAITAFVFGREAATQEMQAQLHKLLGDPGASAVQTILESASAPKTGTWAAVISLSILLFGASGVFFELQNSLDLIWKVDPSKHGGLFRTVIARFRSFLMVLCIGFLLLVSLIVNAILSGVLSATNEWTEHSAWLNQTSNTLISWFLVTLLFALIFKVLPSTSVAWSDVWLGSAFTAGLYTLGKHLIGLYLGRVSIVSPYGAAGSIVIILLWTYYSAQILFFGAEFTHAYACMFGSRSKKPEDLKP